MGNKSKQIQDPDLAPPKGELSVEATVVLLGNPGVGKRSIIKVICG